MQAILQARYASRRLPGKVMLEILGRPVISYNIERIQRAVTIDGLIVSTSADPIDDPIAGLCAKEGIACFRGSTDDVLDRIYRTALDNRLDEFAKFTADNPLVDPDVIDLVIRSFLERSDEIDYLSNNHPPSWQDGQEVEVIRTAALEIAWRDATKDFEREHVTPFMWDQPDLFRTANVTRPDAQWYHKYRWTLDYPEDFAFIKTVYEALYPSSPHFTSQDVMNFLSAHPDVQAINAQWAGQVWYDTHPGQIRTL